MMICHRYTYDDISSAYSVNATTLGKRSYRRIAWICDGNGSEHEEPKTGTGGGGGEKQELKFEFESEETSMAPGKRRRSAATVTETVSSVAVCRKETVS